MFLDDVGGTRSDGLAEQVGRTSDEVAHRRGDHRADEDFIEAVADLGDQADAQFGVRLAVAVRIHLVGVAGQVVELVDGCRSKSLIVLAAIQLLDPVALARAEDVRQQQRFAGAELRSYHPPKLSRWFSSS